LPDNLRDRVYYEPTSEGVEKRIRERLQDIKQRRSIAQGSTHTSEQKSDQKKES